MITESFPHITRSCIPKLRWVCSQAIRRPEMRVATAKAKTVIVIATSRLKADYVDDDGGDDDDDDDDDSLSSSSSSSSSTAMTS